MRGVLVAVLFCGAGLALDPTARHEMHGFVPFMPELNEADDDPNDGQVSGDCESYCHGASCLG